MDIPKAPTRPRTRLYRISIKGQTPFVVAHFTLEEAYEHAETIADLGVVATVEEVKKCTACNEIKVLHEFSRHESSRDGRQSNCMVCARKKSRLLDKKRKLDAGICKMPPIDSGLACQFLKVGMSL